MKTTKITVLSIILALITVLGCKKEEKTPEPEPIVETPRKAATKIKIMSVEVSSIPALNPIGNVSWDSTHDMDLYFTIENGSSMISDGYYLRQNNKTFSEFPIKFWYYTGWTTGFPEIHDLNSIFFVNVFDDDVYDSPSGTYDICGVVGFDIQNYVSTVPQFITKTSNNTTVTVWVAWI